MLGTVHSFLIFSKYMDNVKFTTAELNQMLSYVENRDRYGWYYGNKEQFEKRHLSIKEKINFLFRKK